MEQGFVLAMIATALFLNVLNPSLDIKGARFHSCHDCYSPVSELPESLPGHRRIQRIRYHFKLTILWTTVLYPSWFGPGFGACLTVLSSMGGKLSN